MKGHITVKWDRTTTEIDLPYIAEVTDSYNASLTEISTLIYGAENRFVMDLGVQRSFDVSCVRINPDDYDDSSDDWLDSAKWSNGKWMTKFIQEMDHWQNQMKPNGGFIFKLTSPDTELYPTVTKNVFLRGNITPKYSLGKMTFTLPLVVGSMKGDSANLDTVTLTFRSGTNPAKTYTQSYPKNALVPVPSIPASWQGLVDNSIFSHWETSGGAEYPPGKLMRWTTDMTLTAQWQGPIDIQVFSGAGAQSWSVPAGAVRVQVHAVGAGGGGGGSYVTSEGGPINYFRTYPGGGGGAGEYVISSLPVRNIDTIYINIGAGGDTGMHATDPKNGGDGQQTTVTVGRNVVTARGGSGGSRATGANYRLVPGGQMYYAGGDGGESPTAGHTSGSPGGSPGSPGPSLEYNLKEGQASAKSFGGAGGGAAPLNIYVGGRNYSSAGGNGGYLYDSDGELATSPAGAGRYGGGAGSGHAISSSKGGDGFVALMFFK